MQLIRNTQKQAHAHKLTCGVVPSHLALVIKLVEEHLACSPRNVSWESSIFGSGKDTVWSYSVQSYQSFGSVAEGCEECGRISIVAGLLLCACLCEYVYEACVRPCVFHVDVCALMQSFSRCNYTVLCDTELCRIGPVLNFPRSQKYINVGRDLRCLTMAVFA
jgi:hypothetical protein